MGMLQRLFDLSGQVALITGASRGFGLEFAKLFAEAGAVVVINGRHAETLQTAADVVRRHGAVETAAFDVADIPAGEAAIAAIEKTHGRLDILINNAGMNIRKPLDDYGVDDWRQVIEVDLTAAFALSRAASRGMVRRGYGRIINIGSVLSVKGRASIPAYTAAKHGLLGLTKSCAAELGAAGVTCNAIAPGYFETEINAELLARPDFVKFVNDRTPLRRWGKPEELAGAALFLASPAASYVNGHLLTVDGGMTTTF
ncbi:MAG TPA: SDR family oxidoreductase [Ferrovibrio sp.]|uniref:SDR family oxidoreductase n=1 Tax=Ferrovibrio sp. TaxID=1917215 RepID=UPI002ED47549